MANTYTKLGAYTFPSGASAAAVGFTSIPQTYTDLIVHLSVRSTYATGYDSIGMYFNGVQTTQSNTFLNGTGSGYSSNRSTYRALATINSAFNNPNVFSSITITIPNYAATIYKQISIDHVLEGNQAASVLTIGAELWSNTAAINSITFDTATSGVALAQYTEFTLYGVKNS
jgi:hypothetical protein